MAPMSSSDADLSNLSAAELVSRLSNNPGDLDAVARELSAREARHKAAVTEIQEEIHGHLTVALSKVHESQEEGAFLLEATLSRRSGRKEEAVVAEIYAGEKARIGRIAAETRAKVKSSFSKLRDTIAGASETVQEDEQLPEEKKKEEERQAIMQEEGDQDENEQDDEVLAGFESAEQQQGEEDDQSGQQNQQQGIMHDDEYSSDDEELDSYERAWWEYESMLNQNLINLGRGRGRGRRGRGRRGRGRGRGTSPAEALAAAALRFVPVNASPEALQRWMSPQPSPVVAAYYRSQRAAAASLGTTVAGSSDSILQSKGKAPLVEYINPEDEHGQADGSASSGTS